MNEKEFEKLANKRLDNLDVLGHALLASIHTDYALAHELNPDNYMKMQNMLSQFSGAFKALNMYAFNGEAEKFDAIKVQFKRMLENFGEVIEQLDIAIAEFIEEKKKGMN